MPRILDVEAALLLLELEPPFDQRSVQLARRRMAKRWHPDIAPPGRRAYENEHRAREQPADRAKHDPFGSRVPDHSVVHRYARCVSYPEWGVGTVSGIYFSGDEEASQQWARVMVSVGVRTVPSGRPS